MPTSVWPYPVATRTPKRRSKSSISGIIGPSDHVAQRVVGVVGVGGGAGRASAVIGPTSAAVTQFGGAHVVPEVRSR